MHLNVVFDCFNGLFHNKNCQIYIQITFVFLVLLISAASVGNIAAVENYTKDDFLKTCIGAHCLKGEGDTLIVIRRQSGIVEETIGISGEALGIGRIHQHYMVVTRNTAYLISEDIQLLDRLDLHFIPKRIDQLHNGWVLHQASGVQLELYIKNGDQLQIRSHMAGLPGEFLFQARNNDGGDYYFFLERLLSPDNALERILVLGYDWQYVHYLDEYGRHWRMDRSADIQRAQQFPFNNFVDATAAHAEFAAIAWEKRLDRIAEINNAHLRDQLVADMITDSPDDPPAEDIYMLLSLVSEGHDSNSASELAEVISRWDTEARRAALNVQNSSRLMYTAIDGFLHYHLTDIEVATKKDSDLFLKRLPALQQENRQELFSKMESLSNSIAPVARKQLINNTSQPDLLASILPAETLALNSDSNMQDIDHILLHLDRLYISTSPTIAALRQSFKGLSHPVRAYTLKRMAERGKTEAFLFSFVKAIPSLEDDASFEIVGSLIHEVNDDERRKILSRLRDREDFNLEPYRLSTDIHDKQLKNWPHRFVQSAEYRNVLRHQSAIRLSVQARRVGKDQNVIIRGVAPGREGLLSMTMRGVCNETGRELIKDKYIKWVMLLPVAHVTAEYEITRFECRLDNEDLAAYENFIKTAENVGLPLRGETKLDPVSQVSKREHIRDLDFELTAIGKSLQREADAPSHCISQRENCLAGCAGVTDSDGGFLTRSSRESCRDRCYSAFYHCTEATR